MFPIIVSVYSPVRIWVFYFSIGKWLCGLVSIGVTLCSIFTQKGPVGSIKVLEYLGTNQYTYNLINKNVYYSPGLVESRRNMKCVMD